MFNKYVLPPKIDVTVEVPPINAADSARLYGELRDKAQTEVARATIGTLGAHNIIRVVEVRQEHAFDNPSFSVRALFTINGLLFDIKTNADDYDEKVKASIASQLFTEIMRALNGK